VVPATTKTRQNSTYLSRETVQTTGTSSFPKVNINPVCKMAPT